jgi:hypothetical protein
MMVVSVDVLATEVDCDTCPWEPGQMIANRRVPIAKFFNNMVTSFSGFLSLKEWS